MYGTRKKSYGVKESGLREKNATCSYLYVELNFKYLEYVQQLSYKISICVLKYYDWIRKCAMCTEQVLLSPTGE